MTLAETLGLSPPKFKILASDIDELKAMDAIISCQGGDYTKKLRAGWKTIHAY